MGVETLTYRGPGPERAAETFGFESLKDDILATRVEYNWNHLVTTPPGRRERPLRRYLDGLDGSRHATRELAEQDAVPKHILNRIDATYGGELAQTWHTFAPDSVRTRPLDIRRKLVEWQHASQRYLLVCRAEETEGFWRVYEDLSVEGSKAEREREQLRAGILGPVATVTAIRSRLGWEAAPPDHPEDDEHYAVDLVTRTPEGKTILFQIETTGTYPTVDWERVPKDDRTVPRWKKTADLQRGMREYVPKHGLDRKLVEGLSLRIPYRSINRNTGDPDGATSGKIKAAVLSVVHL